MTQCGLNPSYPKDTAPEKSPRDDRCAPCVGGRGGDAVAGVLVPDRIEEGFNVYTVAVVPEHQGRGMGRELMRLAGG